MAPMTSTDGDVLQNKLNMLFASRQRLLETWLPPRGAEELANAKSTDELEREEEAIFRPIPTTYDSRPRIYDGMGTEIILG